VGWFRRTLRPAIMKWTGSTMETKIQQKRDELVAYLRKANDIAAASYVLMWDQSTYMPPAGAGARARQVAALQGLAHEHATDPAIGRLLDELQPYADSLPPDADDAALVQVARRNYDRLTKVPADFAAAFAGHSTETFSLWAEARPANDFRRVQAALEKTLDMSRKYANFFPGYQHIADPLIDTQDYGMSAAQIGPLFEQLRQQLSPLVKAIGEAEQVDDSVLRRHYPQELQSEFGKAVVSDLGFDFQRGRMDTTHHPFMTKFAWGDVRITTRYDEHELSGAIFSSIHETGHALYELGIDPQFEGTPLDTGTSAGVHESQSRLWENVVGRSAGFWEYYFPKLRAVFPQQLADVEAEDFYRAVNKSFPSLIRTEADEVTYNLHVIIRFGLELDLLEGKLAIADLPEAWHARYRESLGVSAPDDRDGILQDVHWYSGPIGGAFQGYTLGNIMAAQFYAAALRAHPEIPAEIRQGRFGMLHNFLRENIYRHGSKFTANELLARVTGGPLTLEPYLEYLRTKYSSIYNLKG
jgi:carboxypeptidase Taq